MGVTPLWCGIVPTTAALRSPALLAHMLFGAAACFLIGHAPDNTNTNRAHAGAAAKSMVRTSIGKVGERGGRLSSTLLAAGLLDGEVLSRSASAPKLGCAGALASATASCSASRLVNSAPVSLAGRPASLQRCWRRLYGVPGAGAGVYAELWGQLFMRQ